MLKAKDYIDQVNSIFSKGWQKTQGRVVPTVDSLQFDNSACEMDLAMLFVDIRESTTIVDTFRRETTAKMYKSFLWGVSQLAIRNNGELRSFNGDGVLVVFGGASKCDDAVMAAMQMNWFASQVIRQKTASEVSNKHYSLNFNFGIGVDVGRVLVMKGGIRGQGNNDLVWVGNATNYAVKFSGMSVDPYNIHISQEVYNSLDDNLRLTYTGIAGSALRITTNMWEKVLQLKYSREIYRTCYYIALPD